MENDTIIVEDNTSKKDNTDMMAIIAKLLEQETDEETRKYKNLILKRIATETDIRPARVPAPLNITEIGGYYNLLRKNEKLQMQLLASVLGLPYSS